jgi:hypothetical protein
LSDERDSQKAGASRHEHAGGAVMSRAGPRERMGMVHSRVSLFRFPGP